MSTAGYEQERQAILTAFQTGWLAANPTCPVALPNMPWLVPKATTWARFVIVRGPTQLADLGGGGVLMKRSLGAVTLQILSPAESGAQLAMQLADSFANIFDNLTLTLTSPPGVIVFYNTSISLAAPEQEWYVRTAMTRFRRDIYA